MTGNQRKRWLILGGLLLATMAAAVMVDSGGDAGAKSPVRGKTATAPATRETPGPGKETPRRELAESALPALPVFPGDRAENGEDEPVPADPFRARTWVITPPPAPPPPPSAPPLPFKYMGKIAEEGGIVVFLSHQNRNFIARQGDRLNGIYQVEEISADKMTFVYEPLKQRQELTIGGE